MVKVSVSTISIGQAHPGDTVRIKNGREGLGFGNEFYLVAEVKRTKGERTAQLIVANVQPNGTVKGKPRNLGSFGLATRLELHKHAEDYWNELAAEAEAKAAEPKGPRVRKQRTSEPMRTAVSKLIRSESGSMTRKDLHADPMIVKSLNDRGWAKVDREGSDRSIDLIELTADGRKAAATMGLGGSE